MAAACPHEATDETWRRHWWGIWIITHEECLDCGARRIRHRFRGLSSWSAGVTDWNVRFPLDDA